MIEKIKQRVLKGREISFNEALYLMELEQPEQLQELFSGSKAIREKFRGKRIDLCSITNAKSGNCSQDCTFCAQSVYSKTDINTYPLISVEEILQKAEEAFIHKAHRFCIVTSGCSINAQELRDICKAIRLIKQRFPTLKIDASLGKLTGQQAQCLKDAGLDRYNHNIETVESYFRNICTTHTFEDRLETLRILKEVGIQVCCGGIIGLGETNRQRVEFAFYLKELDVDCIPINFLNPVKGIPLQNNSLPHPQQLLKIIAIFRFILPKKQIRICGGRERNLGQYQSQIFSAGADAIILGNYLTTKGNEPCQDLKMISELGLVI